MIYCHRRRKPQRVSEKKYNITKKRNYYLDILNNGLFFDLMKYSGRTCILLFIIFTYWMSLKKENCTCKLTTKLHRKSFV